MKTQNLTIKTIFVASIVLFAAVLLTGCSDDKPETVVKKRFDHPHGPEVSNLEKHQFEHQFADQCVAREIKKSDNREADKKRFAKSCLCIATYMMKNLTAVEAEKFLKEHENTQSLRIRFDNAAYHCLQQKIHLKRSKILGTRQYN